MIAPAESTAQIRRPRGPSRSAQPRPVHPLLQRLWELHPLLFGANFRPLKIGIFEDLMARHPEEFVPEELKQALAQHVRSTRYLDAVADGQPRCDLDGKPVEPVAPEHVQHAVGEVFRRRQGKDADKARRRAVQRMVRAIEASGATRQEWMERMPTRDPALLELQEAAFAELSGRQARHEALRRAYEASGRTVEEFAQMYGVDVADVRAAIGATAVPVAPAAPAAPVANAG